ncbi:MAG: PRC-barrel domain-containing protein [Steroidobacteraceae bacterium]
MMRIFLPLIGAALGLAAASCSQSEGPFAPAEAPASPHPSSHGAASAAMATPPGSPQGTAALAPADSQATSSASSSAAEAGTNAISAPASQRASTLMGMPVVSTDGSPLGEVKDIVFDPQGRATHVVIAYDAKSQAGPGEIPDGKLESNPEGKLTAVPWDTALASIQNGHVVLDGSTLEGAPSFTPDEWPNLDDPAWSATADAYWHKVARPAVAAHPHTPIDSTARLRVRPARDGNAP